MSKTHFLDLLRFYETVQASQVASHNSRQVGGGLGPALRFAVSNRTRPYFFRVALRVALLHYCVVEGSSSLKITSSRSRARLSATTRSYRCGGSRRYTFIVHCGKKATRDLARQLPIANLHRFRARYSTFQREQRPAGTLLNRSGPTPPTLRGKRSSLISRARFIGPQHNPSESPCCSVVHVRA